MGRGGIRGIVLQRPWRYRHDVSPGAQRAFNGTNLSNDWDKVKQNVARIVIFDVTVTLFSFLAF